MRRVYLIGAGPDGSGWMTREGAEALASCGLLIGAERMLDAQAAHPAAKVAAVTPGDIAKAIAAHPDAKRVAVLLTGDTGFYSGAKKLQEALGGMEAVTLPGVGAHQLLCARLGVSWEDACLISVHGRSQNVCAAVLCHAKTIVLTGSNMPPEAVCAALAEYGLGFAQVTIGQRLGYAREHIVAGTAQALADEAFDPLSVLLIINERPLGDGPFVPGLPDGAFLRAGAPMTKREVRAVSIAMLAPKPSDVVWDIGAGTGSVAIECALACRAGRVYAIERDAQACAGIAENRERFGVWHLQVARGSAPEALAALPPPDRVFIGGSGGNLHAILQAIQAASAHARVVINAITLETLTEAMQAMQALGFADVEVTQVSAARARPVGSYHMMTAQNPVFIIAGNGGGPDGAACP